MCRNKLIFTYNIHYCLTFLLNILLVAKDSDNPFFLKLVLHGLAADWKVDKELLMSNLASSLSQQGVKEQLVTSAANTSNESECEDDVSHATEKQIPLQSTPCPSSNSDHGNASANVISINYTGGWILQNKISARIFCELCGVNSILAMNCFILSSHIDFQRKWSTECIIVESYQQQSFTNTSFQGS